MTAEAAVPSPRAPDLSSGGRIATLDIVRGIAVMGILAMNITSFAMPDQAYLNPRAFGMEGPADLVSWTLGFIFIDGRMRGLFSFLFGASLLLVIERADSKGQASAQIHFSRMAWLLMFGLLHHYLVWYGDILSLYAPVGMIAWFFYMQPARKLIGIGAALVLVEILIMGLAAHDLHQAQVAAALPGASAEAQEAWRRWKSELAIADPQSLAAILDLYRGSYGDIVSHRLTEGLFDPVRVLLMFGPETLAYMLFGMAALRTGFLAGTWSSRSYARIALGALGISAAGYALLAFSIHRSGSSLPALFALGLVATVPLRPVGIVGTAALIILLTRRGGPLVVRIAAAGRAAFTNYLGTSLVMTSLFYGHGLGWFGTLSRAETWLVVLPMWVLMLLWSKPWLDRFRYGPFEWLWRSLARGQMQPMRRVAAKS